ncbi:MAG: hypothetical protein F8N36_05860 [Desulfovibrio sp.]|uniref:hypothetical protein n=1 Tax=Desulfovibrio sp. TaxID=885 RepID=UPI00135DDE43|nr:hypothetical protein [Desulfovibrio sp.]MTJ92373.1 hypothetical protein [Desulfovibrio sp.]
MAAPQDRAFSRKHACSPAKQFRLASIWQNSRRADKHFHWQSALALQGRASTKTALFQQLHIETSTALRRLQAACDRILILRKNNKME